MIGPTHLPILVMDLGVELAPKFWTAVFTQAYCGYQQIDSTLAAVLVVVVGWHGDVPEGLLLQSHNCDSQRL